MIAAADRSVAFTVDGTITYGTLDVPAHRAGQRLAAALLLAGSGPTDRNGMTLPPGSSRPSPASGLTTTRSPMNLPSGAEPARYLQLLMNTHAARLRAAIRDNDRGASAVELAVITAVLVGLAVAILLVIVNFAKTQSTNITNTNVPNPAGRQLGNQATRVT